MREFHSLFLSWVKKKYRMKIFSSLDGHWMNIDLSSLADFKYWNVIKLRFDEKSEEEEATEKDALQMRMKLEISEIMVHQENLLRITSTELIGSMVDICWFSTSLTCFRFGRCITFVKILSPCMDVSLSLSLSLPVSHVAVAGLVLTYFFFCSSHFYRFTVDIWRLCCQTEFQWLFCFHFTIFHSRWSSFIKWQIFWYRIQMFIDAQLGNQHKRKSIAPIESMFA